MSMSDHEHIPDEPEAGEPDPLVPIASLLAEAPDFHDYTPTEMEVVLTTDAYLVQASPIAEMVELTPWVLHRWLTRNMHNRKVRSSLVHSYRHDMANGQWIVTGDPWRFDHHGELNDGQHRALGALLAGVTLPSVTVVRGLDPEARNYFDVGQRRSLADVLTITGMGGRKAGQMSAAIKATLSWEAGFTAATSHGDQVAWNARHGAAMAEAVEATGPAAKASHMRPPYLAAFYYLVTHGFDVTTDELYTVVETDETRTVDDFIEALGSGAGLSASDPVLHLRHWLSHQNGLDRKPRFTRYVAALVVAWNTWLADQPSNRLVVPRIDGRNPAPFPKLAIPVAALMGAA